MRDWSGLRDLIERELEPRGLAHATSQEKHKRKSWLMDAANLLKDAADVDDAQEAANLIGSAIFNMSEGFKRAGWGDEAKKAFELSRMFPASEHPTHGDPTPTDVRARWQDR